MHFISSCLPQSPPLFSNLLRTLVLFILSLFGWRPPSPTAFSLERYITFAESTLPLLYAGRGNPRRYRCYSTHATFEDPLLLAIGRDQIAAAFDSLRLLFRASRPVLCQVLVNDEFERMLLVLLVVDYFLRCGGKVRLCSLVTLTFGKDGCVESHEERWFGLPLLKKGCCGIGRLCQRLRRIIASLTQCVVRSFPPREPSEVPALVR